MVNVLNENVDFDIIFPLQISRISEAIVSEIIRNKTEEKQDRLISLNLL